MDESNNFALVPKPPGALEKTERGARRILSGMVADTLALASSVDAEDLYQQARAYDALKGRNYMEMVRLFRKAAERGHAEASYWLGIIYMSGDGFPQDNEQAYYWIRKGAERGHEYAQFMLGTLSRKGVVGPPVFVQNLPEAYKWFKLAHEHNKRFAGILASLSSAMTPDDLQQGEHLYREFHASRRSD
jgi:TPR repeat protein